MKKYEMTISSTFLHYYIRHYHYGWGCKYGCTNGVTQAN